MAMIANLQYGWTIFIAPIDAKHHWGKAAIQGNLHPLYPPRKPGLALRKLSCHRSARACSVFGRRCADWIFLDAVLVANTLTVLYVGGMIGGVGPAWSMGTASAMHLNGFKPRGLQGVTAAGFGAGAR